MKTKYTGADLSSIVFNNTNSSVYNDSEKKTLITKDEAISTGRMFASIVRSDVDADALVFVFGSTVKDEADINSDIDVAVISKVFDNNFIGEAGRIGCLAFGVSEDIEVHAVSRAEWQKGDPHVLEIQKWGIAV